MKRDTPFKTEAEMCAAFMPWATGEGYTAYPETAGFDILLVAKDGAQIGVEAKQTLNLKVISQALPRYSPDVGPDHRAVLVPSFAGDYRDLLGFIGVEIFYCTSRAMHIGWKHQFYHDGNHFGKRSMFDWNPKKRCELPEYMPDVAAGVPSPLTLTPWKVGALKVLARIELSGSITRARIGALGCDPRRWCSGEGWLVPLEGEPRKGGLWKRGPNCPTFEKQHPIVYAQILAEMAETPETEMQTRLLEETA